PEARRLLREEIAAQESEGRGDVKAEITRLRDEKATLAENIQKAGRRLFTEDESLWPVLRTQLAVMQQEEGRIEDQLADPERPQEQEQPGHDVEARIDRIASVVEILLELYRKADPSTMRDLFTALVSQIELYFDHQMVGTRKRTRFIRGVVHFREDVLPDSR